MELIEGETLEQRVRRAGPLNARSTIKIAQQVTSALAAAEKCGLVHRDLKPGNLMLVSPEGETDRVAPGGDLIINGIKRGRSYLQCRADSCSRLAASRRPSRA